MPALPIIAAIAAIAGTGYSVGSSIYNSMQGSGGPSQQQVADQIKQEQQQQADQQALQRKQAVLGQYGNAQAQVGGSLTDQGFQEFVNQLAGYPGYYSSSTSSNTPTSSTGLSASNTGSTNPSDILNQLSTLSSISGGVGSNQQQPNAEGRFELSKLPF